LSQATEAQVEQLMTWVEKYDASVTNNSVKHNPTSPLLFGEIGEENKII